MTQEYIEELIAALKPFAAMVSDEECPGDLEAPCFGRCRTCDAKLIANKQDVINAKNLLAKIAKEHT
jgi:hypothetical protein